MHRPDIPKISLVEAVLFAQESAAVAEASRQLELNRKIGNHQRTATWRDVLAELQQQHPQADAA